tara:strand:- start:73 stop:456 length:384 start_codon:yes stop_codon:yes gene_type:complete
MIRLLLLFILSLTVSSPVFSLSAIQKDEMQKTIKNMQALMPRRIDAMTTMKWTWMEDNTWYMNTQINTGGRFLGEREKNILKSYIRDQYCRPPYEYLDAGLVITNQYYDENNNFLFAASASKRICGR